MRTAVLRVLVDPEGTLSAADYTAGVQRLRDGGLTIVASPAEHLPDRNREIELIVDDLEARGPAHYLRMCDTAFDRPTAAGVVTYISRGTDEDALGILRGFGLTGDVERSISAEEEVVTVTVTELDLRAVPESRLHTALEAALNCEVRILIRD